MLFLAFLLLVLPLALAYIRSPYTPSYSPKTFTPLIPPYPYLPLSTLRLTPPLLSPRQLPMRGLGLQLPPRLLGQVPPHLLPPQRSLQEPPPLPALLLAGVPSHLLPPNAPTLVPPQLPPQHPPLLPPQLPRLPLRQSKVKLSVENRAVGQKTACDNSQGTVLVNRRYVTCKDAISTFVRCTANCFKQPSFSWLKEVEGKWQRIEPDERIGIARIIDDQPHSVTRYLEIQNITDLDQGRYRCLVTGDDGHRAKNITNLVVDDCAGEVHVTLKNYKGIYTVREPIKFFKSGESYVMTACMMYNTTGSLTCSLHSKAAPARGDIWRSAVTFIAPRPEVKDPVKENLVPCIITYKGKKLTSNLGLFRVPTPRHVWEGFEKQYMDSIEREHELKAFLSVVRS